MNIKLIISGIIVCVLVCSSCGVSKKLQTAQDQINQLQTQNSELTKRASDLNNTYQSLMADFNSYKRECQESEENLKIISDVLTEEAESLQKVAERMNVAMADFKERGVDIYNKNGQVYVSLSDELLYKTGSATLGTDGVNALASLASALNDYPKMKVVVVGNTDDVQFTKGSDNWSLSTERANGVVRILRDKFNIDPARLTAAGKGKYNPVADNATAEGRAKNRRTDIVLNPDLDKLWNSVKQ